MFRFLPKTGSCTTSSSAKAPLSIYEQDPQGCSYFPPKGLYLRLTRTGYGWRLVDRHKNELRFDTDGRLLESSDRLRRANPVPNLQGSTIRCLYDAFGRLVTIEDDLGRRDQLEYYDDPAADPKRYGLLRRVVDFAGRTVEYDYDDERLLRSVKLPEVTNPYFDDLSFAGDARPTIEYHYGPAQGVAPDSRTAFLHGDFARLRLGGVVLPTFLADGSRPERIALGYDSLTGRVASLTEPGVAPWKLRYPDQSSSAAPVTRMELTAPWGHVESWTVTQGRLTKISETLDVVSRDGTTSPEEATTQLAYTDDGRPASVTYADGGIDFWCYVDGEPKSLPAGLACQAADGSPDYLARGNVAKQGRAGALEDGAAARPVLALELSDYGDDNLAKTVVDGKEHLMKVPVPAVDTLTKKGSSRQAFYERQGDPQPSVEVVSDLDPYGRPLERRGTADAPPKTTLDYGPDAKGRPGAGLLDKISQEDDQGDVLATKLEYDSRQNVKIRTSTWGVEDRFDYDLWDRPVFEDRGIPVDGVSAPGTCDQDGAQTWRGFDAAGHLVVEQHLQDYLDESGNPECRKVETRYTYDAREQLVAVRQSYLAAATPGTVDPSLVEVAHRTFDTRGLLTSARRRNHEEPDLVTTYGYDEAGRLHAIQVIGSGGVRHLGYDLKGRQAFADDGDEGKSFVVYDAWDRPRRQESATGAAIEREWDLAGNPSMSRVVDSSSGELLSEAKTTYNSFGALAEESDVLSQSRDDQGKLLSESTRRMTYTYDTNGRIQRIEAAGTGPDPASPRLVAAYEYEAGTGRLMAESHGGESSDRPLSQRVYGYTANSNAPWPLTVLEKEASVDASGLPGELQDTVLHVIARDSFGRPVSQGGTDGNETDTQYDRSGGAIEWETGVGTRWGVSTDAEGRVVRAAPPAGAGRNPVRIRPRRPTTGRREGVLGRRLAHVVSTRPGRTTAIHLARGRQRGELDLRS